MASSQVSLVNEALLSIGSRATISSMTENSNEARVASQFYDSTLEQLLRAAHWSFAKKTDLLTVSKAAPGTPENTDAGSDTWSPSLYPPPPWLYSYIYPIDCLAIRAVLTQPQNNAMSIPIFSNSGLYYPLADTTAARFQVQTDLNAGGNRIKVVCTNVSQAIATYTYNVTDITLWDSIFEQAFTVALAGTMAIPLTGSVTMASAKLREANDTILQARVADGNEDLQVYDVLPDWLMARNVGGPMPGAQVMGEAYGPLFSIPMASSVS